MFIYLPFLAPYVRSAKKKPFRGLGGHTPDEHLTQAHTAKGALADRPTATESEQKRSLRGRGREAHRASAASEEPV